MDKTYLKHTFILLNDIRAKRFVFFISLKTKEVCEMNWDFFTNDKCDREFLQPYLAQEVILLGRYQYYSSVHNAACIKDCYFTDRYGTVYKLKHMHWQEAQPLYSARLKEGDWVTVRGIVHKYKNNDRSYPADTTYGITVRQILN